MKIYISIPITGHSDRKQRRKARMWQRYFEAEGHTVSNPFDIGDRLEKWHVHDKKPAPTYRDYMRDDIAELICCDAIFFVKGWDKSKGCLEESEVATQIMDLKILFEKDYD